MLPLKYAYITGCLIAFLIWIIIFLKRKDLRKEMLVMSLAVSGLGMTELLFYGAYWKPEFLLRIGSLNLGLEDFIVCFLYGGAFGALYEFIIRKTPVRTNYLKGGKRYFFIGILAGIAILILTYKFLGFNLQIASGISLLSISIVFVVFRSDLLYPVIISGLLGFAIAMVTYFILSLIYPEMASRFYTFNGSIGFTIFGYPPEEILWHVPLAMVVSSMYEVIYNRIDRKLPNRN